MKLRYLLLAGSLFLASCGADREEKSARKDLEGEKKIYVPAFRADSAYHFVEAQLAFGPRIPQTPAHEKTAAFLVGTLQRFGAAITVQSFQAETYDNRKLDLKNIIASFNPDRQRRILLAAHWDTRPFADKDPEQPAATFPGANDGASGVAVLLEIARVLSADSLPEVGVDMIFFDGEDWGEKEGEQGTHPLEGGLKEWWCLGSQHWARHKHKPNYSAYYGILLDMVGAKNAQFHKEGYSVEFAPAIVNKVWQQARRLGYSHVFVNREQQAVTDDHVFVNTLARIPMINIVHFEPGIGYFGDFHHTRKDNLDLISEEMLGIVGNTILHVIYHEN